MKFDLSIVNSTARAVSTLLLVGISLVGYSAPAKEIYVATNGRDANAGTIERPFATVARAAEAIRELNLAGELPQGGLTVWVRGGRYQLETGVRLTTEHSGAAASPVVFRAYAGEDVRFIGGREIKGFRPVKDRSILARLGPAARRQLVQVDLKSKGITDYGELRSNPSLTTGSQAPLELFFQDRTMPLARWPNKGFVKIADVPDGISDTIYNIHTPGSQANQIAYAGDRPKRWKSPKDAWIHGYWRYNWSDRYKKVESIDTDTRVVTIEGDFGGYGVIPGQRYYYLNVLEEIDEPGEWYLDRDSGVLYFWPPAPVDRHKTYVSLLEEPVVSLQEASHITLRDITIENTRGHGIEIRGGEGNRIAGCTIRNVGNYGVVIEGGSENGVVSCDIHETGDGGIKIEGGDRKTLEPARHYARNNHIHHFARRNKTYRPAVHLSGVGNVVANNLIHDSPHSGILFGGNDHVIEFNEMHDVALETGDVGALYTGRDWTEQGTAIRYNFFHHIGRVGQNVRTVYLDDCSGGTTIFGNVFYKVTRGVIIGGGRDINVENNIFVKCEPAIRIDDRCVGRTDVWRNMVHKTMKERLDGIKDRALYNQRYPGLKALDGYYREGKGVPPEGNSIVRNIVSDGEWIVDSATNQPDRSLFKIRDNLIGRDPRFVDTANMDFQIKAGSPAYELGFRKIPFEKIGLQKDEFRTVLPPRYEEDSISH